MEETRTLIAGGDMFLCRDLPGHVAAAGPESVFDSLQPLFARGDVVMGNLETVIANQGEFVPKGGRRPFYYHAPPETLDVLVAAGMGCVVTANNHSVDFGPDALVEQLGHLDAAGIAHAGTGENLERAMQPVYLDADGLTVAVISFETISPARRATEDGPGTFHVSLDSPPLDVLQGLVEEAGSTAELVVVSPHWGPNHRDMPLRAVRNLARTIIDMGADVILGHSAHVTQGVEVYAGRPIIYDMGTLLFDRAGGSRLRHSAVFELRFSARGVRRLLIHPVRLRRSRTVPASVAEAEVSWSRIIRLSRALDPDIPFTVADSRLALEFEPREPRPLTRQAPQRHSPKALRPVAVDASSHPAGTLSAAGVPRSLLDAPGLDLGEGLRVYGYRRVSSVRLGYGFLVQVAFRCPQTRSGYWRANLCFRHLERESIHFTYPHPVSEGLWLSPGWCSDEALVDACVVRPPPEGLAPGRYRVAWTLEDMRSGCPWPGERDAASVNWVDLGLIELTRNGPKSVAGVNYGRQLDWVAVEQSDSLSYPVDAAQEFGGG